MISYLLRMKRHALAAVVDAEIDRGIIYGKGRQRNLRRVIRGYPLVSAIRRAMREQKT